MAAKVCFLDTTVFLSHPSIDQIDWVVVLGATEVVLVVTTVVIRQLNNHKDNPRTRKGRERATSALRTLERYSEQQSPVTVRDSVELQFLTREPLIDFAAHRLSREIEDDWLLASILEFRQEYPASEIVVVTDDLGLKLKAKTHQLQALRLPENLRLPQETNPEQARIRELEEQIRVFRLKMPDLRLGFHDGKDRLRVVLTPALPTSAETKARQMEKIRVEHPVPDPAGLGVNVIGGQVVPTDVTVYNQSLKRFLASYEKHLVALDEFADLQQRTAKVDIRVYNEGTCPAEDINIYVRFPHGLQLFQEHELPEPPDPPPALASPGTGFVRTLKGIFPPLIPPSPPASITKTMWTNVGSPSIQFSEEGYEVHWHVKQINHGFSEQLDSLYIQFESWEAVKSFTLGYQIHAGNAPKMVNGQLHVIIARTHVTEGQEESPQSC